METCAADRAAVGPLHPRRQTFIMKVMSARPKVSNQFVQIVISEFCGGSGVVVVVGPGDCSIEGLGDAARPDLILWRLGKGGGES